jgi:hypothetical protein
LANRRLLVEASWHYKKTPARGVTSGGARKDSLRLSSRSAGTRNSDCTTSGPASLPSEASHPPRRIARELAGCAGHPPASNDEQTSAPRPSRRAAPAANEESIGDLNMRTHQLAGHARSQKLRRFLRRSHFCRGFSLLTHNREVRMHSRIMRLVAALTVTGAMAVGGAALASAATSTTTPKTPTISATAATTSATTPTTSSTSTTGSSTTTSRGSRSRTHHCPGMSGTSGTSSGSAYYGPGPVVGT